MASGLTGWMIPADVGLAESSAGSDLAGREDGEYVDQEYVCVPARSDGCHGQA